MFNNTSAPAVCRLKSCFFLTLSLLSFSFLQTISKKNVITGTAKGLEEVRGDGGSYFPLTAVQNWNVHDMRIQNGIFVFGVASLVFAGDFEVTNQGILYFDFDRLDFKLGPLAFGFDLPPNESRQGKKRPFFVFVYADDEVSGTSVLFFILPSILTLFLLLFLFCRSASRKGEVVALQCGRRSTSNSEKTRTPTSNCIEL